MFPALDDEMICPFIGSRHGKSQQNSTPKTPCKQKAIPKDGFYRNASEYQMR